MEKPGRFDCISPLDYRYWDRDVAEYLSEAAFTKYKLLVEQALVETLANHKICSDEVAEEVDEAIDNITTSEVYEEEARIKHDVKALVNCIRDRVSNSSKPFLHLPATSNDIIDTANAARYRDVVKKVLLPSLVNLELVLIDVARREAETAQIGRTHGQHAVPLTFGYAIAGYVSRLGNCMLSLKNLVEDLPGKFSGAVGAYNASSLLWDNPEEFEAEVLSRLNLKPAEFSTQIIPPESMTRLLCEVVITLSVLANLSDDMRNLQRTEIAEIGEVFEDEQVGSSTMPQKRNPINFENAKSIWKIVLPKIMTVFMDEISDHQRDMTNGASIRSHPEIIAYAVHVIKRLSLAMKKLAVNRENMQRNLEMSRGLVLAEPLYIILATMNHPDAHEKVRLLTLQAQKEKKSLSEVIASDEELGLYLPKMTPDQLEILQNPNLYTGIAAKKAKNIAEKWKNIMEEI